MTQMVVDPKTLQYIENTYLNISSPTYSQAYAYLQSYLQSKYPNPSEDQQQVLNWLGIATQMNGGQTTVMTLMIRANNQAAELDENGVVIPMLGAAQQTSSNDVGLAFFNDLARNQGLVDTPDRIGNVDARNGLLGLGLTNPGDWTGASPTLLGLPNDLFGFDTSGYWNSLTVSEQYTGLVVHAQALEGVATYLAGTSLGLSAQQEAYLATAVNIVTRVPVAEGAAVVEGLELTGSAISKAWNFTLNISAQAATLDSLNVSPVTTGIASLNSDLVGFYVVQSGDTWASLATKFGTNGTTLEDMNGYTSSSAVPVGSVIQTPSSVSNGALSSSALSGIGSNAGLYDVSTGQYVTLAPNLLGTNSGTFTLVNGTGTSLFSGTASLISGVSTANGGATVTLANGDTFSTTSGGTNMFDVSGITFYTGSDDATVTNNILQLLQGYGVDGTLGTEYGIGSNGALTKLGTIFDGDDGSPAPTYGAAQSSATSILAASNSLAPADPTVAAPSGAQATIGQITVVNLGTAPAESAGDASADALAGGAVANGVVFAAPGVTVATGNSTAIDAGTPPASILSLANDTGATAESLSGVLDGYDRPGNEQLQPAVDNTGDLVSGQDIADGTAVAAALTEQQQADEAAAALSYAQQQQADAAAQTQYNNAVAQDLFDYYQALAIDGIEAPDLIDIDPLLVDLTGNGINLTNWIDSNTFFDTNVNAAGTGPAETASGAIETFHTSWMNSGTGLFVFDPSGTAITNITQTISEFFAGGPTPYHYTDGLAA